MKYLLVTAGVLALAAPAHAQHMATAMFCNTAAEIQEVITANDPDSQTEVVNARDGDSSCTPMRVVYDAVEDVDTVQAKTGMWTIMRVHITGAFPFPGMMMPFDSDQYAARKAPGQGT